MANKYTLSLSALDGGREGLWDPVKWFQVIKIIAGHQGEEVYNTNSAIYDALEEAFPDEKWRNTDGDGNFRPLFRDYSHPWTRTDILSFNDHKFYLTPFGLYLAGSSLSPAQALLETLARFDDNGTNPFAIVASALLELGPRLLTVKEVWNGILLNWRPSVDDINSAITNAATSGDPTGTEKRRIKLLLELLNRAETISYGQQGIIAVDINKLSFLASSLNTTGENQELSPQLIQKFLAEKPSALRTSEKAVRSFAASLAAKRFLILTGLSGSGKTKLAQAFAAWITPDSTCYKVVPVGADWTGREHILGYPDGINGGYVRQAALELILEARKEANQGKPYFLILDEMNLSHVERYFSDFLSAIESEADIPLHTDPENITDIPDALGLPTNFFVIGTVNVDETTYMFSPKVLDRANVVEFKVSKEDFDAFLDNPKKIELEQCKGKGAVFGSALIQASETDVDNSAIQILFEDGEEYTRLKSELGILFRAFSKFNWEFGFRVGKEVSRFVYFHKILYGDEWELSEAIDAQIIQKLMPKLNGSEDKLRRILMVLAWYSSGLVNTPKKDDGEGQGDYNDRICSQYIELVERLPDISADRLADCFVPVNPQSNPLADFLNSNTETESKVSATACEEIPSSPRYPLSFDKTIRMWKAARETGFTSFAEN